jgi:hypothetical protein
MAQCPGCRLPPIESRTLVPPFVAEVCRRCGVIRVPALGDSWLPLNQQTLAGLRDEVIKRGNDRRKEEKRLVQELRAGIERQLTEIDFGD